MIYQTIYNRLRQLGFSEIGAIAMLGNWDMESGCEPNRLENDFSPYRSTSKSYTQGVSNGSISRQVFGSDRKGFGLAQWTFANQENTAGRKFNLYDFWKRSGKALDDPVMQCDFCWWELTSGGYAHVRSVATKETDLYTAVSKLCTQYEQPGVCNVDARFSAAKRIQGQINLNDWQKEGSETMAKNTVQQQDPVQKVLDIARAEIGYHEQGDNITKYAAEMDRTNWYNGPKNGFPYCDVFYDWLFYKGFGDPIGREMICQPTGSAGAGCLYSAQYYKNAGRWYTSSPQPGDQIFFSYSPGEYSHTGIVESVSGGTVTTIEGNTSDMVARRSYALNDSRIVGYGRPRWELAGGSSSGGDSGGSVGRILRRGCTGADVAELQIALMTLGYDLGSWGADGDFGVDTYNAVIAFQNDHGLEADGEAGPNTLGAIREALKETEGKPDEPAPDEPADPDEPVEQDIPKAEFWPPRTLEYGMRGNDVEVLCALLKARGWGVSEISDVFGSFLEEKAKAFQKAYFPDQPSEWDGVVGPKTWRKLLEL